MRKMHRSLVLGLVTLGLAACAPSPAQVAQQFEAAVNNKNIEAAVTLLAPEAVEELKPFVEDLVAKNTTLSLVGQYKVEGERVSGLTSLSNDEYGKLGVTPVEASFAATVVKGKLTAAALALTPEAQAKIEGAVALAHKKVIDDFEAALNAKNLDAALAFVAGDAEFLCAGKTHKGIAEIKAHYEEAIAKNLQLEKGERTVTGAKVTWLTKATADDLTKLAVAPLDLQGSAVIEDGKIKSFALVPTPEAQAKLDLATATAAAPKKPGKK